MQSETGSVHLTNPAGWPEELIPVFERYKTCEFTSVTPKGQPITYPLTPYLSSDRLSLAVTTGLTYPAKADRVRANAKVSLLYSEPLGSGLSSAPIVLVLGEGRVRSANLQENTDRYIQLSLLKNPEANKSMTPNLVKGLGWYFVRLWVEVVPQDIYWWPNGASASPQHWRAPNDVHALPSDPAPSGNAPKPWSRSPQEWRDSAKYAQGHLGMPVVTYLNENGYPISMRARSATLTSDGFALDLPTEGFFAPSGRCCMTFHTHSEFFESQENLAFVGEIATVEGKSRVQIARRLGNWNLKGGGLRAAWDFLSKGFVLRSRLAQETTRYDQPTPIVRLPNKE